MVLACSGAESSAHLGVYSACALMQEIDIKGVLRYRNCYPLAQSLVEPRKINLKPLVTHRFALEEFEACCCREGVNIVVQ